MARNQQDLRTDDRAVDVTDERGDRDRARRDDRVGATQAPATVEGNGTAVAALVTGLLSATLAFLVAPALAAILFGIVAVALGVKGMGIAKRNGGLHKGLAVSGLVSGALGLLLGIAVIAGGAALWERSDVDVPPAVEDAIEQTDVNVDG